MVRFNAGEILLVCSMYLVEHISQIYYSRRVRKILPTLESPCYSLDRADDFSLSMTENEWCVGGRCGGSSDPRHIEVLYC